MYPAVTSDALVVDLVSFDPLPNEWALNMAASTSPSWDPLAWSSCAAAGF